MDVNGEPRHVTVSDVNLSTIIPQRDASRSLSFGSIRSYGSRDFSPVKLVSDRDPIKASTKLSNDLVNPYDISPNKIYRKSKG